MKKSLKMSMVIAPCLFLFGCASVETVSDSSGEETINTLAMTCKDPYALTQDCSIWTGATRTVLVDWFEVNIAGSDDGKVVLVMDANIVDNAFKDILNLDFNLNSPIHSKATNNSYYKVKKILDENGIDVKRVRPLESLGNVDGYVLELSSDGYSLLKKYSYQQ